MRSCYGRKIEIRDWEASEKLKTPLTGGQIDKMTGNGRGWYKP